LVASVDQELQLSADSPGGVLPTRDAEKVEEFNRATLRTSALNG